MPHDDTLPDSGFENSLRESCCNKFPELRTSYHREMNFGSGLISSSGILHEIDIVIEAPDFYSVLELKNWQTSMVDKNAVINFYAKMVDYLSANTFLLHKEIVPVFIASIGYDINALSACIGLGIHPIAPNIRPVPLLNNISLRIDFEINEGLILSKAILDDINDFKAKLNLLNISLKDTWFSSRFGFQSETCFNVKTVCNFEIAETVCEFIDLNKECTSLLNICKSEKEKISV